VWAARIAQRVIKLHLVLSEVATGKLEDLSKAWETDHGAVTGAEEKRGMHLEQPIDDELGLKKRPGSGS
jgi:hypothetical protein